MSHFHPLRVKHIERITPNSVTVAFEIPNDLESEFKFTPGQYINIKKELNGQDLRRSYSICSSPNNGELTIGIKKVASGLFSRYANNELKAGDVLEIYPPLGHFTFDPAEGNNKNIAAFAAGSGITPIMSIMKTVLEETNSNFVLVFGNKSVAETMFHKEILDLVAKYPDRLSVYFIYSQEQDGDSMFGRIERSTVNFVLNNKHKEIDFDAFYLCGPEAMIHTVSETLTEKGVAKEKIKFELFTTSDEGEEDLSSIPEGKTKVKVIVDDEEFEFVMDHKERVLDAALKEDIDAPYSCQGGICSSCMAKLKEGKVEMVKNQILTDSELEEGLILTCQSHPLTDTIVVDYDDI
ncbi:ferredoxin--NADP reductase [Zhouia amylolytica]|uniref:ferredoxin--NADP reductase n=1 Tax=Zhouia amylolytica TaxID=376730 RepID=UPI0020CD5643|nr:ferredoxin--NADP reductase [Zhouia amylolytica]MCQ0112395.1 ferredoxin--NADP reductase [Zhouia amylolytica]